MKLDLEKLILKVKHFFETAMVRETGYNPSLDPPDERDYKFAEHFPDDIFGAVLEDRFVPNEDTFSILPYQDSILSCVSCTCTFINSTYSKRQGNDVFLSWRFPYALVHHYPGGTSVRENMAVLKRAGQCEDALLPQREYYRGESVMQNEDVITQQMVNNAKSYKIGAYYSINKHDQVEMKTAIQKAPIGITLYVGYTWKNDIITWDGVRRYGHMVALVGWDDNERVWYFADWDYRGIKKLSYDYPIISAWVMLDKSDKLKGKLMRPYKLKGSDRLLVVLPNGKYQWVSSPAQWKALHEKKVLIGDTKEISKDELDQMEQDDSPLMVVK